jgi:Putative zinc-finger
MSSTTYPAGWTCESVSIRLERYLLSTLPQGEALAIAEHIEACVWCGQALVLLRIDRRVDAPRG